MTAVCDLCGCPLERPESVALHACAECRLCIANENTESLSERRRQIVEERIARLGQSNTKGEQA